MTGRHTGDAKQRVLDKFDRCDRQGLWLMPECHAEEALLHRLRAAGEVTCPCRGIFARTAAYGSAPPRVRSYKLVRTLGKTHPEWIFCLYSAAMVHGLQVPNRLLDKAHVVSALPNSPASPIARHTWALRDGDVVKVMGVQVTSLRRTLIDCLCAAPFKEGLAIVDSALHWGMTSEEELSQWLAEDGFRKRGVRQARETLLWADGRSENGGESIARATMIELGFQPPELQVEIIDPMEPDNPKYGDFGWCLSNGHWIIGELDGLEKYRARAANAGDIDAVIHAMAKERRREAHINMANATVIRFFMEEVYNVEYFENLLTTAGVPRRDYVDRASRQGAARGGTSR